LGAGAALGVTAWVSNEGVDRKEEACCCCCCAEAVLAAVARRRSERQ